MNENDKKNHVPLQQTSTVRGDNQLQPTRKPMKKITSTAAVASLALISPASVLIAALLWLSLGWITAHFAYLSVLVPTIAPTYGLSFFLGVMGLPHTS
jgi:hypothetical protein